jgi:glycosyltransferase involved in cell wall biosynthesis
MIQKKLISVFFPCFNEKDNIPILYKKIIEITARHKNYEFEIIVIDNNSDDGTQDILKQIALKDPAFRVIFNTRNFGHVRSPYYGIMQCRGDAVIYLASDLQDPPELIPKFLEQWEKGWKIVLATKPESKTSTLLHAIRKAYYRSLNGISDISLVSDATGFGLYDKAVMNHIKSIADPYPYLRGLICELGYPIKLIPFNQKPRERGITKNNFYSLYDVAMLGIVSHSKLPLRIASFAGFVIGILSFISALTFLLLKLWFWDKFPIGIAPVIIGMFFLFGSLMLSIGILGEYIGSIHVYLQKRPIVVERERLNFSDDDKSAT